MINWDEAPLGTTHHTKTSYGDDWFRVDKDKRVIYWYFFNSIIDDFDWVVHHYLTSKFDDSLKFMVERPGVL